MKLAERIKTFWDGQKLNEIILRSGFKKSFIADAITAHPSMISHYINGRPPKEEHFIRLVTLLRCDAADLLSEQKIKKAS